MSKVFIDSSNTRANIHSPMDEDIRCEYHPADTVAIGFGLAGGGFGPYTYCATCGVILSKTNQDEDDE